MMKIYIVGSVGSGKSTLARSISSITGIPCVHLDEVVHVEDRADSWGNHKRPVEERDAQFRDILSKDDYIIEDAGRACFSEGMLEADTIVLLDPPPRTVRRRILLRFMKQNLGIEKCIYKPHFKMLKSMFKWAKDYQVGEDSIKARLAPFQDKTVILTDNKAIRHYLSELDRRLCV